MSTGSLLFPIGYVPLDDNGNPVPAGKLAFSRTGTSTAQDTFSDSTLDTANANPVVLNSAGRLTTKVYGNPASGFDYRVRLLTSADVEVWSFDDVKVDGASTATLAEGSFTGTLTGMDSATTGTVKYRITSNAAGTGKICRLYIESTISGTSNTTAMTMTGLPAACAPSIAARSLCELTDNSTSLLGLATISAAGTTITFGIDQPFSSSGFTGSNTKGLTAGWQFEYAL